MKKRVMLPLAVIAAVMLLFSLSCWGTFLQQCAQTDFGIYEPMPFLQRIDYRLSLLEDVWKASVTGEAELSHLDAIATYVATGQISSTQVIKGKDGWLFYKTENDGNTIADFEGTNSFTEEEAAGMLQVILAVQNELAARNISFAVLVPPNKENVYPHAMPEPYVHGGFSRTDRLCEYLTGHGAPVVNPREQLQEYPGRERLYYSYDTHWNLIGGYIGARMALKQLGIDIPRLSERQLEARPLYGHFHASGEDDLAQMLNMRFLFNDDPEYTVVGTPEIDWKAINRGMCVLENPAAMRPHQTLLLVGDSFRIGMLPALSEVFGRVCVVHWGEFEAGLLERVMPDHVIAECVERYSGTYLPLMASILQ